MDITPYLQFNDNCAEAFDYYQQHLGGRDINLMRYRGTPAEAQVPEDRRDKVMHGSMQIGEKMLMGSDAMCPDTGSGVAVQGFSIALNVADDAEAKRVFDALAQGGKISMPLEKTFWASSFGMLTDQFGIPWMINCGE